LPPTTDPAPERGHLRTLGTLVPYLWPVGERGLRARVVISLVLLVFAKGTNVLVPLAFARAVDALAPAVGAGAAPGAAAVATLPIALVLAYGLTRLTASAFNEARDAIFARVQGRALRQIALRVFAHLHRLSLRFHLDRQTGGMSRVIERGTRGMTFVLDFLLFNIVPTIFEILLVSVILWGLFDFSFTAVILATVGVYIAFTLMFTEWRIKFRRRMNETDQDANTKAVDSLLNFETVKYFGNEAHEARRYDASLERYERAYVRSRPRSTA
jgi:ATP-binding cassette subfamily B protein